MRNKDEATIKDVAERAGVAPSTASDALNGKSHVADDTRSRVLKAAADLNYRPHPGAKHLSKGSSNNVGLLLPISDEHLFSSTTFFNNVARGMHQVMQSQGYVFSLYTSDPFNDERDLVKSAIDSRELGGLVISNPTTSIPYWDLLKDSGIPYVFIGDPRDQATYVDNDNVEVARKGTEHLIEHDHERIACVTGPSKFTFSQDRELGYRSALKQNSVEVDEDLIWNAGLSEAAAYEVLMEKIEKHSFSAVFVVGSMQAIGVIYALRKRGLEVPDDVALVSVGATDITRYFDPSLTVIDLNEYWLGYHAAQLLLEKGEGETAETPQIIVPTELMIRESCGCEIKDSEILRSRKEDATDISSGEVNRLNETANKGGK
jgi:DNA-binding LacI/PurR family transcriptional regulator